MADDDEIDVLGDFSFNSCFAQNNQGIPSCSNREDTVHPQWLLDATETNWYDKKAHRIKEGSPRKLYSNSSDRHGCNEHTAWSHAEKQLLVKEMAKYGRNTRKISQTIKTKTEAEIQALIEAEYGVNLETPLLGVVKHEEIDNIPAVVQEEVVTDDSTNINNVLNTVATGSPTINIPNKPFRKKNVNSKSLLKPDILKCDMIAINPSEILYEDDLIIGSTESIGTDLDLTDLMSKNIVKYQAKVKAEKKIGNHRRKVSRSSGKAVRNKSKELRSPQGRQRKDSSLSEDSVKSPKMQIVLGSGQALPVSEGEQVIKIEKKKESDPESDIEIDIDSGNEDSCVKSKQQDRGTTEEPIAVPLRKFEPMPKRQKKINLDGGGGYTIMHTEAGDLYEKGSEPRKERPPRKQQVHLLPCRLYNAERPAPYEVRLHVSTLMLMDAHAHTSRGEVMGLVGGDVVAAAGGQVAAAGGQVAAAGGQVAAAGGQVAAAGGQAMAAGGQVVAVNLWVYSPAAAAAGSTHCDMDPVSQSVAAESVVVRGGRVCGWHHSHPAFPPAPSALDLAEQRALQRALRPCLGLITSPHWPTGRTASQYRCIRVEDSEDSETPIGYQFSVKLTGDLTADNLPAFIQELRTIVKDEATSNEFSVDMAKDVCPQAGMTYLEKFISSASHHMRSAGYADDDSVVKQLLQGIRDVFR